MTRLVYHRPDENSREVSPFDASILQVARSGNVRIVSPFIGTNYLRRIVEVCNSWRLLSDVEAWLSALSIRARPEAWEFIRKHVSQIHHCPAIHAKVIASDTVAMLGSANFTNAGVLARPEMGVLFDEPDTVR